MSIVKNPYNSAKVAQIRQLLINNAQSGKPTDYEIFVDELKIIHRTGDPELFDSHEEFIDADTRYITIVLYDGASRRCTKHLFHFKESKDDENLSGVKVNKLINDKLEKQQMEWKFQMMQKEKEELQHNLDDAEAEIVQIQKALQEALTARKLGDFKWGEIASVAIEELLKRNAPLFSQIPGIGPLAGVFANPGLGSIPPSPTPDTGSEMTFKEHVDTSKRTDKEKEQIDFANQLEAAFTPEELDLLLDIIRLFIPNKGAMQKVLEYLQRMNAKHTATDTEEQSEKKAA